MCLAIPMRILSISDSTAVVEQSGVRRQVSIALVPEVSVGSFVLIHAGFAIAVVSEDEARENLRFLEALGR